MTLTKLKQSLGAPHIGEALLQQAITHASYAKDNGCANNERLEFLGDSILGAIAADTLYARHGELPEGELTRLRAQLVQGPSLAALATRIGIAAHVRHTLPSPNAKAIERLLEQAVESVIAAIFLELGYEATRAIVADWLGETSDAPTLFNPKGALQELLQPGITVEQIEYRDAGHSGPDHNRQYTVALYIKGELTATATAASKKAAQEQAALEALKKLK